MEQEVENLQEPTRGTPHNLVTGKIYEGEMGRTMRAGTAQYFGDTNHFEVMPTFLQWLGGSPLYLSRNKDSDETYTIFTTKKEEDGRTWFVDPVGKAAVADKANSYLQLYIPLWRTWYPVFVSLFPATR
jgi:hypothetical protein